VSVCALAALISLILLATSTPGLRPSDVPFLGLVVAPYALLGLLALRVRGRRTVSRLLFVVALILALAGTALFGWDSYQYHTVPEHRLVQRMTLIAVPVLQSLAVALTGLILLAVRGTAGSTLPGDGDRRDRVP